ncbi:hypothetical protein ABZP36_024785 [Zizania latifolia]
MAIGEPQIRVERWVQVRGGHIPFSSSMAQGKMTAALQGDGRAASLLVGAPYSQASVAVAARELEALLGTGGAGGFARDDGVFFGARDTGAPCYKAGGVGVPSGAPLPAGGLRLADISECVGIGAPFDKAHGMAAPAGKALDAAPSSPSAGQVSIDVSMVAKPDVPLAADARGHGGNISAVVGIVAASSAVTMVAAGAVSPPVAFGLFVLLLGGLTLAVNNVR